MDIQSTLYFQIAADVFLCLSMAALVLYLRKGSRNKSTVIDGESVRQLRKLLAESQKDAEQFFQSFDECCRTFRALAADLETREKRLSALIEEAKKQQERSEPGRHDNAEGQNNGNHRYSDILRWLGEGVPVDEIAKRTGTTSGEILLIADLEKARKSSARAGQ
jgi:DNA-binding NarL/FixJ family response regulator